MRYRWRRSRPPPTATSSRSPADAAPVGTAAPMAAAAAITHGRDCTPARAAGTPAPMAAAAPTGGELSSPDDTASPAADRKVRRFCMHSRPPDSDRVFLTFQNQAALYYWPAREKRTDHRCHDPQRVGDRR